MASPRSRRCMYSTSTSSTRPWRALSSPEVGVMARSSSVSRHRCGSLFVPPAEAGEGEPKSSARANKSQQTAVARALLRSLSSFLLRVPIPPVHPAPQGLHAALDQARGGGLGAAEMPGDLGQRTAFQVAQPDRFALVGGQRRQRPGQALGFLAADGLLAGGGEAGIESLLQGHATAPGIVDRL